METGNRKEFSRKDIENFGGIRTKIKKKKDEEKTHLFITINICTFNISSISRMIKITI